MKVKQQMGMAADGHARAAPDSAKMVAAPGAEPARELSPAAERALAEAAERRRLRAEALDLPKEVHGRGGSEPVRFGDWEVKGLAVDF